MGITRRKLVKGLAAANAVLAGNFLAGSPANAKKVSKAKKKPNSEAVSSAPFRLWASACSHVLRDLYPDKKRNAPIDGLRLPRESLAIAIRQSEGFNNDGAPRFDWDAALHLGDFSSHQGSPSDEEGEEVVRQFGSLRQHQREDFYCIAGNHDANLPGDPEQWWFRKWIDPLGQNPQYSGVDASKRKFPIEGTWERYSFRVGNILFLMMSDRNHAELPVGRGERGGYPAGAVSLETFQWWKQMVEKNQDSIIVSAHHHMLRNTTVASGPWEGLHAKSEKEYTDNWKLWYPGVPLGKRTSIHPNDKRYHSYYPDGGPEGTSYLYFVGDKPNAGLFEAYLEKHPGAIDIWLGAHTHTHPDDNYGGKTHIEQKWGVTFINVAALTEFHSRVRSPMSRLIEFMPGSSEVLAKCYLHNDYTKKRGWYESAERRFKVGKVFQPADANSRESMQSKQSKPG